MSDVHSPLSQNAVPPVVTRYSAVAVALHWLIAALLISNILLGWAHEQVTRDRAAQLMAWHKSTGIVILLLSLIRLAWRLLHPAPPYPSGLPRWERLSARAVHYGFYAIMIGMPLTGWIMASGPHAKSGLSLYKMLPWPLLSFVHNATGAAAERWHRVGETHTVLAYFAYALIVLHVLAALKHQYISRDVIMARMSPFRRQA